MAHEIQHTATRLSQNLGKNNYANGEPPARAYSIFAGGDWDQVLTSEITD
jgi:hypothetical protein